MKKNRFTLTLCTIILLMCLVPTTTAYAASYPLIYIDTFESSQTIVEGDTGKLTFNIFIEYKNERYNVEIYDSNNRLVGSASNSYYNSYGYTKTVNITVDTEALDLDVGRYKIVYWMDFYTFSSWHSAPNKYTSYFSVIEDICGGNHDLDLIRIATEATCEKEGTGYYSCDNCDYVEYKAIPKAHNFGEWSVISSATCSSTGEKQTTCQTCGVTETETIPKEEHSFGEWEVTKATTCTEDGTSQRKCTECNHTENKNNIAVGSHTYINECDIICDVCNFERTITHTYSNNCDKICNVCSFERSVDPHIYTNTCDTDCNECGEQREITHTYDNACDTNCNVCDDKREISHNYSNTCDTICNVCDFERTITHTYSNNCDKICNVCSFERSVDPHIYTNTCDTDCNECGEQREITHTYDNSCDTNCNVCNETRTVEPHKYDNGCDTDCNICTLQRVITHSYDDKYDKLCNICQESRKVPMKPVAITFISLGGTTFTAGAGFSVYWFAIKKKSWSELVEILKATASNIAKLIKKG